MKNAARHFLRMAIGLLLFVSICCCSNSSKEYQRENKDLARNIESSLRALDRLIDGKSKKPGPRVTHGIIEEIQRIKGVNVKKLTLAASRKNAETQSSPEAHIVYYKDDIGLVLHLDFASGKSDITVDAKQLIKGAAMSSLGAESRQAVRLRAFGHTDIELPLPRMNFNDIGLCSDPDFSAAVRGPTLAPWSDTNGCLGLTRAAKTLEVFVDSLGQSDQDHRHSALPAEYHPDPFLDSCNDLFGGQLMDFLSIPNRPEELMVRLEIESPYNVTAIRNSSRVQDIIATQKTGFRRDARLFRSVVIIANFADKAGAGPIKKIRD